MADVSVLELVVTIQARPATVYRFLADPERFRQWMGEGAERGAWVGDAIGIGYQNGTRAEGRIVEQVPDRLLVFTYGYAGNATIPPGSTTVRIELQPAGEETRVAFRHEGLPDDAARAGHRQGWSHYLSRLRSITVSSELAPLAHRALEAWIAAWGETEPGRRRELIAACWEESSVFADQMGTAEGRSGLDGYIAAAQQFMPGSRLELRGPAEVVLDRVKFQWAGVLADGSVVGGGVNFGELTGSGRFRRMTGWWIQG